MATQFVIIFIVHLYFKFICVETSNLFGRSTRQIILQNLQDCKGTHLPWHWSDFKVTVDKTTKQKYLNLKMTIKTEVSTDFWMKMSFLKCDSSGNPDNCEYIFKDKEFKNICHYIDMKNQPWSEFLEKFDKKIHCPIKPDRYSLNNLPITSNVLEKVPIPDAVWKLHMEGYDKRKKLACVDTQLQIITIVN